MKHYLFLLALPMLLLGCTKNNQGSNPDYAYLSINQTFTVNPSLGTQVMQTYDINNDGQTDWGFNFIGNQFNNSLNEYSTTYTSYVIIANSCYASLPSGYNIDGTSTFENDYTYFYNRGGCNDNLKGSGDFYIGFKSQNPQYTNTYYGWARMNLSTDGYTVVVKDMALNTVNGGSIATGQH